MTPAFDRAVLAVRARKLRESVSEVCSHETDEIVLHRLSDVLGECMWCERHFGEKEKMRSATEEEVDRGEAKWCSVCESDCVNKGKDFLVMCEKFMEGHTK